MILNAVYQIAHNVHFNQTLVSMKIVLNVMMDTHYPMVNVILLMMVNL